MARSFPWLDRVSELAGAVRNSVRSHYTRRDLEVLFRVTRSAAGRLLELLATERIGGVHVVQREVLGRFLEQVAETEDVAALVAELREERGNLSRAKARYLLVRDAPEVAVTSLPVSIRLEPGTLRIDFGSLEELVERLALLAQAMQDDPVAFELRCETAKKPAQSAEAEDARMIAAEIEEMKAASAGRF